METLDFGEPKQNEFGYPMPLVEKYQPRRIEDFIGLEGPKRLFGNLLKAPRPVAVLLVGPPGCGKTTLGMAFADELPGTLHHISSQKCDVSALDRLSDLCQYYPSRGKFHVVLVDEADQMTEKAQLQLLSRLDGTASLKPKFGGGWERGPALPVIWIFTCNGRGWKELARVDKAPILIQWSYAGRTPEGTPAEESAYYTGAEQDQSMQARLDNKHSGVALGLPQRSRHTASSHSSDRPPDCANRDAQFGGALGMTPADRE